MKLNKVPKIYLALTIFLTFLSSPIKEGFAMSNTSKLNVGGSGEGFGITRLGGHQHGSNSLGVWLSGAIRLGLSDTVSFENYHGVGVVDAKLSRDELIDAKEIHRQLCAASINGPVHEVPVKRR